MSYFEVSFCSVFYGRTSCMAYYLQGQPSGKYDETTCSCFQNDRYVGIVYIQITIFSKVVYFGRFWGHVKSFMSSLSGLT